MKLYAVRDKETQKLVNNITNPSHKFWAKRGTAQNAILALDNNFHGRKLGKTSKDFEVVEYELVEVKNEND